MTIQFEIKGNQKKPNGNPIPYFRTTQRAKYFGNALRYQHWKTHVMWALIDGLGNSKDEQALKKEFELRASLKQKVISKARSNPARMDIQIYWANKKHGDPDNVFKGIADALFQDDKYLAGSFDYEYAKDKKGKVVVTLTL